MSSTFPSLLYELKLALIPYRHSWNLWIKSPHCFLSPKEIQTINNYLKTGSYTTSSKQTRTSEVMLYITIKNSINKLNIFHAVFTDTASQNPKQHSYKIRQKAKKKIIVAT